MLDGDAMRKSVFFGSTVATLACCWGLLGCGGDAPPKTIQDLSSSITRIDQSADGKKMTIFIKQDSIFQGGNSTKKVLSGLMQHFASLPFDEVDVVMNEVLVDRYGHESTEPILRLVFPRSEVEKINFKNVVGWDILNISNPHRIGNYARHVLEQECAEDNNAKYAGEFCENAMM